MRKGDKLTLTVDVKNTGSREGAEIVQLYISDPQASIDRPVKELKGFEKVNLKPGEMKKVSFTIDAEDLSWFDADKHEWVAEPGEFKALISSTGSDVRAELPFELK